VKAFVIIITIIAVLLGTAYFLGWLPWSRTSLAPLPVPVPTPTPTPSPAPSPSPSPSPGVSVVFGFAITDISGSGFSRTITAQVSNSGQADAHNVWAEVQVFSGGSKVKVSGQDYLRVDIGILKSGEIAQRQVTVSFSFTDGLKISQNGATFKITLHSDEHTETFSYDYAP